MPLHSPTRSPVVALLALLLGLTVALIELDVIDYAFERVGVESRYLISLLAASLLGSGVNVPLARRRDEAPQLSVNLGGAVIPTALSAYLLWQGAAVWQSLLAVALVAIVVHRVARPVAHVGITVPIVVAPLLAAGAALLLAPSSAPAVAYVAGTLGTLIGADLSNLAVLRGLGGPQVSIGGAGTFDGIFVTGILAVLLA